jgi:hypothetical protein
VEALWAEVIKKQIRFWPRTHPRDAGIEFISPTLNRYFCLVAAGFHEATSFYTFFRAQFATSCFAQLVLAIESDSVTRFLERRTYKSRDRFVIVIEST